MAVVGRLRDVVHGDTSVNRCRRRAEPVFRTPPRSNRRRHIFADQPDVCATGRRDVIAGGRPVFAMFRQQQQQQQQKSPPERMFDYP